MLKQNNHFLKIITQYIRFQNKMLQHGIKSHKAIIPQIVKFFFYNNVEFISHFLDLFIIYIKL